jgi:acyl carrier protein phosphodiesterase
VNYLAHAYLSFSDPGILVGNMISDHVKGKKKFDYAAPILKGIMLHRYIDNFTDTHEATAAAKEIFRPHYRLYSGALVDVLYDYYLANDENEFTDSSLLKFSAHTYQTLDLYTSRFPPSFAAMYPYMKEHNWLYHYRSREGIARSLQGVVRRATYLTESATAFRLFEDNYQRLQTCYRQFWKDLKLYAREQYELLAVDGDIGNGENPR